MSVADDAMDAAMRADALLHAYLQRNQLREPATLSVFYRGSFDEERQHEALEIMGRENCVLFGASYIPSPDMDGMMNQETEMVFVVTAALTGATLEALRAAQFRTVLCGVAGLA